MLEGSHKEQLQSRFLFDSELILTSVMPFYDYSWLLASLKKGLKQAYLGMALQVSKNLF